MRVDETLKISSINISGLYNNDYDIVKLHHQICKHLESEKDSVVKRLRNKSNLLSLRTNKPQSVIDRRSDVNEKNRIEKQIEEILSGNRLTHYHNMADPIINKYRTYPSSVKILSFDEITKSSNTENLVDTLDPIIQQKVRCIEEFFVIARKYINISVRRNYNHDHNTCECCGESLTDAIIYNGMQICAVCDTEVPILITSKNETDVKRVTPTLNSKDESAHNFFKSLDRDQGKKSVKVEPELFLLLDEYFSRRKPDNSRAVVLNQPLNEYGFRGDTTPEMMWSAVGALKYQQHYENYMILGHLYWNWTLPDYSPYMAQLEREYAITQEVFYNIPVEERLRSSSLGTELRKFLHLQRVGHPCKMEHFKIASNVNSRKIQKRIWDMMLEGAGLA